VKIHNLNYLRFQNSAKAAAKIVHPDSPKILFTVFYIRNYNNLLFKAKKDMN